MNSLNSEGSPELSLYVLSIFKTFLSFTFSFDVVNELRADVTKAGSTRLLDSVDFFFAHCQAFFQSGDPFFVCLQDTTMTFLLSFNSFLFQLAVMTQFDKFSVRDKHSCLSDRSDKNV